MGGRGADLMREMFGQGQKLRAVPYNLPEMLGVYAPVEKIWRMTR
jgi:hypothetical protein